MLYIKVLKIDWMEGVLVTLKFLQTSPSLF